MDRELTIQFKTENQNGEVSILRYGEDDKEKTSKFIKETLRDISEQELLKMENKLRRKN